MSRFISNEVKRIDLGDGEWIEIKVNLPYQVLDEIYGAVNQSEGKNIEFSVKLLENAITGWNLFGPSKENGVQGDLIPFSVEQVRQLDVKTILEVAQEAIQLYTPSKKN